MKGSIASEVSVGSTETKERADKSDISAIAKLTRRRIKRGDNLEVTLRDNYVFDSCPGQFTTILSYRPGPEMNGEGREVITGHVIGTSNGILELAPGWDNKRDTPDIRRFYHKIQGSVIYECRIATEKETIKVY